MKKDFIPRRNAGLNVFEGNFLDKLSLHADVLNLRHQDTDQPVKAIKDNRKAFLKMNLMKANFHAACEAYNETRKRSISEIRRLSKRIKCSDNYTRALGADLNILTPGNKFDNIEDLKPTLKFKVDAGRVIFKFTKQGTNGIKLYSRIAGENKFKLLDKITRKCYTDDRNKSDNTKPEAREYYAVYFINLRTVGKQSVIVKVVIP